MNPCNDVPNTGRLHLRQCRFLIAKISYLGCLVLGLPVFWHQMSPLHVTGNWMFPEAGASFQLIQIAYLTCKSRSFLTCYKAWNTPKHCETAFHGFNWNTKTLQICEEIVSKLTIPGLTASIISSNIPSNFFSCLEMRDVETWVTSPAIWMISMKKSTSLKNGRKKDESELLWGGLDPFFPVRHRKKPCDNARCQIF